MPICDYCNKEYKSEASFLNHKNNGSKCSNEHILFDSKYELEHIDADADEKIQKLLLATRDRKQFLIQRIRNYELKVEEDNKIEEYREYLEEQRQLKKHKKTIDSKKA